MPFPAGRPASPALRREIIVAPSGRGREAATDRGATDVRAPRLTTSFAVALVAVAAVADASDLAGRVTLGIRTGDPVTVAASLERGPRLDDETRLIVAWTAALEGSAVATTAAAVRRSGATPWLRVELETPAPVLDHLARLETELAGLAGIAAAAGDGAWVQAVWRPETGTPTAADRAYLFKRAAVAVTGAAPGVGFTAGPLPPDPGGLAALYAEEVAAYLDVLVLAPEDLRPEVTAALAELDPGKPLVVDGVPGPREGSPVAAMAAAAAAGASVVLVEEPPAGSVDPAPLVVAARELAGQLVHDPYSVPSGAEAAWVFVREDLGLRVVAVGPSDGSRLRLVFADPLLRAPELVDPATGEARTLTGVNRGDGYVVVVDPAPELALLRLERAPLPEGEGFEEAIDVGGDRQMPVEEILRRLQAFEDDQDRRLEHYRAKRTMDLRFQGQQGSIDATYAGRVFVSDEGLDWVWSEFYIGGVKWRSRKLPKVPLIQPEKVGSLPVEIRLEKDYDYRLRGADVVDGRDCWVVDFQPVAVPAGESRYQGTVWVDREVYARVRTRAVQVGLAGDVLSNEETYFFSPVDAAGAPAAWRPDSFILPLRISGQQVFTVFNATLPVEIDNRLSELLINDDGFEDERAAALASEATMVRDTADGLRYLDKTPSGERVVEEEFDSSRLFMVGGVFWDESVDTPIPAIGVDYIDLDFKDSGAQLNVFFAGLLLAANISDPDFLGSRWNAGASVNGLFFEADDELYRDGEVVPEETVSRRTGSVNVFAGRPFADFFSLELGYRGRYTDYDEADDTADGFIVPASTFTHTLEAGVDYNRAGFRIGIEGSANRRADWAPWGLPDNPGYSPDHRQYELWQATFAKTWWFERFHKIGLTLEYLDSDDTDRFSGYDFGLFGDSTVAGYPSGLVRAERATGAHLTGGINVLELIRFSVGVDAVWASSDLTGLDNELLAGIGAGGTLTLPWQLVMNFDVGYALAGPGEGDFAVRLFLLKLFPSD
jgi:hypothetical protein